MPFFLGASIAVMLILWLATSSWLKEQDKQEREQERKQQERKQCEAERTRARANALGAVKTWLSANDPAVANDAMDAIDKIQCISCSSSVSGDGLAQTLWLFELPDESQALLDCLQQNASRMAKECASLPYGKVSTSRSTSFLVFTDNEKAIDKYDGMTLTASL